MKVNAPDRGVGLMATEAMRLFRPALAGAMAGVDFDTAALQVMDSGAVARRLTQK
ncbi:hypothetical protein [Hyphomonas sp.]|jgi:hypothetical protein|uniref:hypothetical protein n=1 Tax=Hyphomonas sp. TaxID=87 RepID=UPI0037C13CEC